MLKTLQVFPNVFVTGAKQNICQSYYVDENHQNTQYTLFYAFCGGNFFS